MSNDPFSVDMFGNTAPSSGLGLGITALDNFAPELYVEPAKIAREPTSKYAVGKQGDCANLYLKDNEDRGIAATWKERACLDVAAILTARKFERKDVPVTGDQ